MAYMNQEKKRKINEALKTVVPKDWKYSLRVRNHLAIVMTIYSAPVDLIGKLYDTDRTDIEVNPYWADKNLKDCVEKQIILKALECLNLDNFDNSDPMTDYFHVGHYVELRIGAWDKGFVCTAKEEAVA